MFSLSGTIVARNSFHSMTATMSSLVGGHLMKRGFEAFPQNTEKEVKIDLPGWVIAMLAITAFAFMYALFMIEYTFGRVIPTLIMVESPQDTIAFEAIPSEDDDMVKKNPEPVVARPKYLTSTFRSSLQLLKAEGGYRGRFRGIGMFVANGMAINWISSALSSIFTPGVMSAQLFMPIAAVICAQLSLGWTLVVVSETSPKFWFRRIPSFKAWKKIAGPTAVYSVLQSLGTVVPLLLLVVTGWTKDPNEIQKLPLDRQQVMALEAIGIFAIGLVYAVGILLPAKVTLTRMQASLIDESEETLVPFDRTFGGKVVPEIVGGSGMIGALDAWKTFDKSSRIRLIKAYAKCFAMVIATSVIFTGLLVAECAVFAPSLHKAVIDFLRE